MLSIDFLLFLFLTGLRSLTSLTLKHMRRVWILLNTRVAAVAEVISDLEKGICFGAVELGAGRFNVEQGVIPPQPEFMDGTVQIKLTQPSRNNMTLLVQLLHHSYRSSCNNAQGPSYGCGAFLALDLPGTSAPTCRGSLKAIDFTH